MLPVAEAEGSIPFERLTGITGSLYQSRLRFDCRPNR
jgi:hypothetical protein